MFDGTHHMFGFHGFGWIFWILLLLGGAWLIARITGRASSNRDSPTPDPTMESPMDTLKRRYASGEISTEEFEERKQRLNQNP